MAALCRPSLTRLCAETGHTALLMVRHTFDSVCMDRRDGRAMIPTLTGGVGGAAPLGIGPGSQAILAFLDEKEREVIVRHNAPRYRATPGQTVHAVRTGLQTVRRQGFAVDHGGLIQGVSGIAVPIRPSGGGPVGASLGLGLLSSQADDRRLTRLRDCLMREAAELSRELNPLAT